LHHLALHGWGIVYGLDVSLAEGATNTLRIEPGLAVDPAGNFVNVPQGQTYQITQREKKPVYIVLQLRELLAEPAPPSEADRASPHTRVLEAYRIQERDRLPEEPYIELARVDFVPGRAGIRMPADAESPGPNELDLRARVRLGTLAAPIAAAPVPAVFAPQAGQPADDGLTAELAARVQELSVRLDALAAASTGTSAGGSAEAAPDTRVAELARGLRQLSERIDALGAPAATGADERASNGAAAAALAERLDALAQQVQAMARQVELLEQRGDSTELAQRVDGLAGDVGALAGRLEGSSRSIEALERELATAQVQAAAQSAPASSRSMLHLAVFEHGGAGWDAHADGVRWLARELGNSTTFDGQAVGARRASDTAEVEVLYISGHGPLSLSDDEADGISRVLENGGVVIGEGCAAGPSAEAGAREFAMSFVDLATRLGRQLSRVDRAHPLMSARHVFGEPPAGARAPRVIESGGMVYSDADYGCAWQGGPAEKPLPRAAIRDAFEFGTNLAIYRRAANSVSS
jgi:hypothetical protein